MILRYKNDGHMRKFLKEAKSLGLVNRVNYAWQLKIWHTGAENAFIFCYISYGICNLVGRRKKLNRKSCCFCRNHPIHKGLYNVPELCSYTCICNIETRKYETIFVIKKVCESWVKYPHIKFVVWDLRGNQPRFLQC